MDVFEKDFRGYLAEFDIWLDVELDGDEDIQDIPGFWHLWIIIR